MPQPSPGHWPWHHQGPQIIISIQIQLEEIFSGDVEYRSGFSTGLWCQKKKRNSRMHGQKLFFRIFFHTATKFPRAKDWKLGNTAQAKEYN